MHLLHHRIIHFAKEKTYAQLPFFLSATLLPNPLINVYVIEELRITIFVPNFHIILYHDEQIESMNPETNDKITQVSEKKLIIIIKCDIVKLIDFNSMKL